VRSVRPDGRTGGIGLILPTIPWTESAAQYGRTGGANIAPTHSVTDRLRALAHDAEKSGATSLWACDHLFWHQPLLEPLTALAVAATSTRDTTLGTCVLQLPMRSPAAVARQIGSLQLLSSGRIVLGLGIGSHPGEYAAAGVDYDRRGQLLDDGIGRLRAAWASAGTASRYRQEPAADQTPIWIAGMSSPALRRVARVGDGWVPMFVPPAEFALARRRLADLVVLEGREPGSVTNAVVALVCVGPSAEVARKEGTLWLSDLYALPPKAFERHLIAGTPDDCASGLAAFQDAGADHVVVMVAADETLDHFGPVLEYLSPSRRGLATAARSSSPQAIDPGVVP
jgi:alkanesulfonate monooxygenase SsuD/methylene tetrahydromethanopterin reductase-like flavin-dependent oxidoreductase (luciferase family)